MERIVGFSVQLHLTTVITGILAGSERVKNNDDGWGRSMYYLNSFSNLIVRQPRNSIDEPLNLLDSHQR
jgi:hypothetical protein